MSGEIWMHSQEPWHYDVVVERVSDLVSSRKDLLGVREMLRRNVHMLTSTFRYYGRLGTTAEGGTFSKARPSKAKGLDHDSMTDVNRVALGSTGRILGTDRVKDVVDDDLDELLVGRPTEALGLGQFRQLVIDCGVLSTECRMTDIGRLFALCSRPMRAPAPASFNEILRGALRPEGESSSAGGGRSLAVEAGDAAFVRRWAEAGIELGAVSADDEEEEDSLSVHDVRRRVHVYGFIECLIRIAATKYGKLQPALALDRASSALAPVRQVYREGVHNARQGKALVLVQFEQLLTDCILPYSCAHENTPAHRWDALHPDGADLFRQSRAQLDKVFFHFAKKDPRKGTGVGAPEAQTSRYIAHGASSELYDKFRDARPNLQDTTLSYNQLCHMLDEAGLMANADLPPRKLSQLWEEVMHYPSVQSSVQKANLRAEMTRLEFVEFLLAVRRVTVRRGALSMSGGIATWFVDDLLPMINQAMPLRGDSLSKSLSNKEHYLSTNSSNLRAAKERLKLVPLFIDVADERFIEVVGGALEPRSVEPDEVIMMMGEEGYEMYFLVEGEVEIVVGGRLVAVLGPGSWFGEMALLSNEPRNADVIGSTHAELFALSKAALEQAVAEYPRLRKKLDSEMRQRQAQIESREITEIDEPTSITSTPTQSSHDSEH